MADTILSSFPAPAWKNIKNADGGDNPGKDNSAATSLMVSRLPPKGGEIYYGAGVHAFPSAPDFRSRDNLRFVGSGWGTVLKRTGAAIDQRIFSFGGDENTPLQGCENIVFQDLAIDVAGIQRFGGLAFYNCKGVRFEHCLFFDSNLQGTWVDFDHLGLVFQNCEDVLVEDCHAIDVELVEFGSIRNGRVRNCTSKGAAGTAAVGFFGQPGGAPYCYDLEVSDVLVIDPRKLGVVVAGEAGASNVTVRGVSLDKIKVRHEAIARASASVAIGQTDATASSGNAWSRIGLRRIQVEALHASCANHSLLVRHAGQPAMRFQDVTVRDFQVWGSTTVGSDRDQIFIRQIARGDLIATRVWDQTTRGYRIELVSGMHIDDNYSAAVSPNHGFHHGSSEGGVVWSRNRAPNTTTPLDVQNGHVSDQFLTMVAA